MLNQTQLQLVANSKWTELLKSLKPNTTNVVVAQSKENLDTLRTIAGRLNAKGESRKYRINIDYQQKAVAIEVTENE